MNRKIMILMVAVVATVLPAVAVADVMITGSVQASGQAIPDAFIVQPGSNYGSAHSMAGFTWTSSTVNESEDLGNISLGYMTNETILEINVLDINFTSSAAANFYVNVTVPGSLGGHAIFPKYTYLYFSTTPFSFVNGAISPTSSSMTVDLHATGTTLISFIGVTSSTHIYVAFQMGAGPVSDGGSFNIAMNYVS